MIHRIDVSLRRYLLVAAAVACWLSPPQPLTAPWIASPRLAANEPTQPVHDPFDEPVPEARGPIDIDALLQRNGKAKLERLSPPSAEVRKKNAARIAQLFPTAAARTFEAKSEFAQNLVKTALETSDDADSQFELLDRARAVAVDAGDVVTALESINALDERFQVDGDALRIAAIEALAKATMTAARRKDLTAHGIKLVDDLLQRDHYLPAAGLIKTLTSVARRNRDNDQLAVLVARQKLGSDSYQAFKTAGPAIERLRSNPDDTAAALAAGKFFAFAKGAWDIGLPLLAAGSDAELRRLADMEMSRGVSDDQRKKLADGWYALAGDKQGIEADRQRARARLWYEKVVGRLQGLAKVETQQRIDALAKSNVDGGLPYGHAAATIATVVDNREPFDEPRGEQPKPTDPAVPTDDNPPAEVDLFALVDLRQDVLAGEWQKKDGVFISPAGEGSLQFPWVPSGEYDLEAVIAMGQPKINFRLRIPNGGRTFTFSVNVDGVAVGKVTRFKIEVRRSGVAVYANGKLDGTKPRLADQPFHPNLLPFTLMTTDTLLHVQSLTIIELDGHGRPLRPTRDRSTITVGEF